MKNLRKILLGALFLTALPACPSLHQMLAAYGYVELKPPSKIFAPGTIVWVRQTEPFEAGVICTAERAMGPDFVPMESPTMNRSMQKAAKKGVNLTADVQALASGKVNVDAIENVQMTFKNAKIVELNDADIQDLAYQRRDARCIRAVDLRRRAGFTITMISSALQADVDYSVSWSRSSSLSAEAKVAQLQALSAQLGLDANATTDKTMSGTGLYFGVKDDQFLSWLWLPEQLPPVERNSMVFDPEQVADIIPDMEDARSSNSLASE